MLIRMIPRLCYLSLSFISFSVAAQAELPPPPGFDTDGKSSQPAKPSNEAPLPPVQYEEDAIILNDLVGDVTINVKDVPKIDLKQIRLDKIRGRLYRITFTFAEALPIIPEDKYCNIRLFLDLDRDSSTGRSEEGLGYERYIGFYNSGSSRGWMPWQSVQSDNRIKRLELGPTEFESKSISMEFETPRASELDHFEARAEIYYSGYTIDEYNNVVIGFDKE